MLRQYLESMGGSALLGTMLLLAFLALFMALVWRVMRLPAHKVEEWGNLPVAHNENADEEGKK